ncbi:hypothetical protein [Aquitalea sp.]|uniref:hypothetical protein n=1 Tax=Aquitalea sp. TaxID=1872623 RepID=UPI0025852761|nr:hypothetical protein [Aquitalea sp.]
MLVNMQMDSSLHHAVSESPSFRIGYFFAQLTRQQLNRYQPTARHFNLMGAANCNEGEIDCKHFPLYFEIPCRKAGIQQTGKQHHTAARATKYMPAKHDRTENMTFC